VGRFDAEKPNLAKQRRYGVAANFFWDAKMKANVFALTTVVVLGGCASFAPTDIAKPSDITVQNALADIGDGLTQMKQKIDAGGHNFGLLADEVTIELKVGANAKEGGKLAIDVGRSNIALNGEVTKSAEADRANTITIKFKNLATATLNESAKASYAKSDMQVPGKGGSSPPITTLGTDKK
jgi:hypothetical protein